MYFDTWTDAIAMGGHGAYVWSAYAITATIVIGLLWSPLRRTKAIRRSIRAELRRRGQTAGDANAS